CARRCARSRRPPHRPRSRRPPSRSPTPRRSGLPRPAHVACPHAGPPRLPLAGSARSGTRVGGLRKIGWRVAISWVAFPFAPQHREQEFAAPGALEAHVFDEMRFLAKAEPLEQVGCRVVVRVGNGRDPMLAEYAEQIVHDAAQRLACEAVALTGRIEGDAEFDLLRFAGAEVQAAIADQATARAIDDAELEPGSRGEEP